MTGVQSFSSFLPIHNFSQPPIENSFKREIRQIDGLTECNRIIKGLYIKSFIQIEELMKKVVKDLYQYDPAQPKKKGDILATLDIRLDSSAICKPIEDRELEAISSCQNYPTLKEQARDNCNPKEFAKLKKWIADAHNTTWSSSIRGWAETQRALLQKTIHGLQEDLGMKKTAFGSIRVVMDDEKGSSVLDDKQASSWQHFFITALGIGAIGGMILGIPIGMAIHYFSRRRNSKATHSHHIGQKPPDSSSFV